MVQIQTTVPQSKNSNWNGIGENRPTTFAFEEIADSADSDAAVLANAITNRWQHKTAAAKLLGPLNAMLKVGLANLTIAETEELPDSVYVMF